MAEKNSALGYETTLFDEVRMQLKPASGRVPFKFVDLFSGIGGFRLVLERTGGHCLFSSEWDKNSRKTYHAWFGEKPHGDITKIKPSEISDHDVLAAGFPYQAFFIARVSKKNSLVHAATQGTVFYALAV